MLPEVPAELVLVLSRTPRDVFIFSFTFAKFPRSSLQSSLRDTRSSVHRVVLCERNR
jgi:hypothetical protein